jgi:hypothetical protein
MTMIKMRQLTDRSIIDVTEMRSWNLKSHDQFVECGEILQLFRLLVSLDKEAPQGPET